MKKPHSNHSGCCAHDHEHSHDDHGYEHDHGHSHRHGDGDFNLKEELAPVVLVTILFILGSIFEKQLHNTPYSVGEYLVFIPAYLLSGWNVLTSAGRNVLRGRVFDENFLMTVATLGAIAIHQLPEAVGVMLFFKVGELFQEVAISRSRKSIKSLLEIRPDYANLQINGEVKKVSPDVVAVGDIIVVKPGEKIPLDGEILEGNSQLDTSALTGESVPRTVKVGETVLAGMINKTGFLTIKVNKVFGESSISKILDLVQNASSKKAESEKFITKFARSYTPFIVFGSLAVALLPPLFIPGATSSEWVYRSLVLLVISCPCGLVISIPLGYFGGVGGAARRGILVKGSTFLDTLTAVKTVVFDKTGTLTGCVAKTGGSLVKVVFVLTVASPTHLVHEPKAPVQMASLSIRHHPVVCAPYLRYPLSYRNLSEMMLERGLTLDHTTVYRWVQAYAPELDKRCRSHLRPTNDSWRVDETYISVKGEWKYLYRAVDSEGNTLDFLLSARRDARAAERFFRKVMNADHNQSPRVINVDKNAAYPPAIDSLKADETLPKTSELRPVKYLNNMVEQDHRFIKRLVNPGMGFASFSTARRTLRGYEAMNMIRKGQIRGVEKEDILGQVEFVSEIFPVAG